MAGAGGETAANNSTCSRAQEQQDALMGTLPDVFEPSEISSDKCAEVSISTELIWDSFCAWIT